MFGPRTGSIDARTRTDAKEARWDIGEEYSGEQDEKDKGLHREIVLLTAAGKRAEVEHKTVVEGAWKVSWPAILLASIPSSEAAESPEAAA